MRDAFDSLSRSVAEAKTDSGGNGNDELMAMEQVLWCPHSGQPRRITLEECERRRASGDPECANPANQLDGYHFCLNGNWKRRVFWVEPCKDGLILHIRFEEE